MQQLRFRPQVMSFRSLLLALVVLVVVGSAGLYVLRLNAQQQKNVTMQPVNGAQPESNSVVKPRFNIEVFYANLQTGMTPAEVTELAGKQPDDCAGTDSVPPSETCFWYSDKKTVSVSYGNKSAVQSINKTGF